MYETLESVRSKVEELKRLLPAYDLITSLERLRERIPNPSEEMLKLIDDELYLVRHRP